MTKIELLAFYKSAEEKQMTVAEVADELCVNDSTVRQYCMKHNITLKTIGNIGRRKRCTKQS